jgi:hypothetical protein
MRPGQSLFALRRRSQLYHLPFNPEEKRALPLQL